MSTVYRIEQDGSDAVYFQVRHVNDGQSCSFETLRYSIRTAQDGARYVYFDEPEDCEEIAVVYDVEGVADTWAMCDDENNVIPLDAFAACWGREVCAGAIQ